MKKLLFYCSATLLCGALVFTGCKKKSDSTTPDDSSTQKQNADDDARTQSESNSSADDANSAISNDPNASGRLSLLTVKQRRLANVVAGADSIIYDSANQVITIYYDGTTEVNGRTRSGSITIQLPLAQTWTTANAQITLTYNYLTCTRKVDGKVLIINGSKTITNLSGGLVSNLSAIGDSVSHQIQTTSAGLSITFDNGKTATWFTNRTRTIKYAGSTTIGALLGISSTIPVREYRFTLSGNNTSLVAGSNVAWWGTNRNGESFRDAIVTPIVYDESIDWAGPISGQLMITGIARTLDITYGVDLIGDTPPTTSLIYGYKLSWTNLAGVSSTAVISY